MPATQPRDCEYIVPSRFSVERPHTWRLVMDEAGRALAARYGNDASPQRALDEVTLHSRDQHMREEAAKRQAGLAEGTRNGRLGSNPDYSVPRVGVVPVQKQLHYHAGASVSSSNGRITAAGVGTTPQQEQRQRPTLYSPIPREVPVSSFH
ncbi:hypothetical protein DQ04_01011110 [Trypanosoma grayi]|uniref:hypothetical protein n=1 Tax=Trypanosoma grayi TaxID=71804 RepID=UPI0004F49B81|nr:hypothetical protein DQ04_01011110 [Trypanosoma grayi]KEG13428.1 hypothetical protein DQ04_01011110 [Trypanosoma grayi]